MNLQVMKWLLANRSVVSSVLDAVKGWKADLSLAEKWSIISKVAAIVVPLLDKKTVQSMMAAAGNHEVVEALSVDKQGVEMLGVDWPTVIKVIVPIINFILQILSEHFGE